MTRDRTHLRALSWERRPVDARLERWGKWARDNITAWPTRTILGRLIEDGPSAYHNFRQANIHCPEQIAITGFAVGQLEEITQKLLTDAYTKWLPREVLIRISGLPTRTWYYRIDRGRDQAWRIICEIEKYVDLAV